MEYLIIHNAPASRFELHDNPDAYVVYRQEGDTITFTGTKVPKELEGRGIAAALVKTALDYAAGNNLQIGTTCSYIVAYLKRHPEYLQR